MDQLSGEAIEETDLTLDPATLAFETLRDEVAALRDSLSDLKAQDYAPTLGVMTKCLHAIEQRLGAIEMHGTLKLTPEQQKRFLSEAGSELVHEAVAGLEKDGRRLASHADLLRRLIGVVRDRRQQRKWLMSTLIGGFVAGLLLMPLVARALPFGWESALVVAILGEQDRWHAGWALIKAHRPEAWEIAARDWNLAVANKNVLAGCRAAVAKSGKAEKCTITVGVE